MIKIGRLKMIDSGSNATGVESVLSSGRPTQNVPTNDGWTRKLSSSADQRIQLKSGDDLKSMERNTYSSDVKPPADIDASSYNKSNLENPIESSISYSSTAADADLLWPEKSDKQSAGTDCLLQNDNNQTNSADATSTVTTVDDLDSVSLKMQATSMPPTSRKKSPRSKHRKPSKAKDVLDARTWRTFAVTSSSELSLTSTADDVGLWMMIAERAPLQASADNVSAIGYKSAILLSEEVATVSAAVASVLIFWSLLGTAICLVLRMRRRKRRRHKRHSLDDVTHIDMLDEMIRSELARGRARSNTSCTSSQSPPTYVNVPAPPPFAGFQTAFDSVQLVNSYNSISHNHNRQNVYQYFVAAGTGSQFVASERHPLPTRSVYNSPNIERVACVRLSNARSFEVLQKTVRPRKMDFYRSRSFNEKSAKAVVHLSQEKPSPGMVRVSGSPYRRSGAKDAVGYVSLRDRPILAGGNSSRQDLSWVGFPPIKTSFDKTRTPEHPTESTVLNGQYQPYHVPHRSATSSVLYGASRPYQDRGQGGPPGHQWLGECRGPGMGDIRWRGYPSHHFVGCRPMHYTAGYCSSRPVRFPKMGQSCLFGELQRNASNPSSCSRSGGREAIDMFHCM